MRQIEPILGPRDGHIAKPPLLLHAALVHQGARAGEDSVLHAGDEHGLKLQPLGGVNGHHGDLAALFAEPVHIRNQGRLLQEALERGGFHAALILGHGAHELVDVLQSGARLLIFLLVLGQKPGLFRQLLHEFRQGQKLLEGQQLGHDVGKAAHRHRGAGAERVHLVHIQGRAKEGILMGGSPTGQGVHRRLADAALGLVDHPAQGHLVAGIDADAHVAHHVLDFLALIKAMAAVHLVGNAGKHQLFFQHAGLGVGAVQHGHLMVRHARGA